MGKFAVLLIEILEVMFVAGWAGSVIVLVATMAMLSHDEEAPTTSLQERDNPVA